MIPSCRGPPKAEITEVCSLTVRQRRPHRQDALESTKFGVAMGNSLLETFGNPRVWVIEHVAKELNGLITRPIMVLRVDIGRRGTGRRIKSCRNLCSSDL